MHNLQVVGPVNDVKREEDRRKEDARYVVDGARSHLPLESQQAVELRSTSKLK